MLPHKLHFCFHTLFSDAKQVKAKLICEFLTTKVTHIQVIYIHQGKENSLHWPAMWKH